MRHTKARTFCQGEGQRRSGQKCCREEEGLTKLSKLTWTSDSDLIIWQQFPGGLTISELQTIISDQPKLFITLLTMTMERSCSPQNKVSVLIFLASWRPHGNLAIFSEFDQFMRDNQLFRVQTAGTECCFEKVATVWIGRWTIVSFRILTIKIHQNLLSSRRALALFH
jgi:hypothetical protein